MNHTIEKCFMHLAAATLLAMSSSAMGDDVLGVQLKSFRVVTAADGSTLLAPAQAARPGDVIEYQATYHNKSDETLRGLVTTLPIPVAGAYYVAGSAQPAGALASAEGRGFAPVPLQQVKTDVAGVSRKVPVPVNEYRALRWVWPQLAAGESQTVSARVRVDSNLAVNLPTNQGDTQ